MLYPDFFRGENKGRRLRNPGTSPSSRIDALLQGRCRRKDDVFDAMSLVVVKNVEHLVVFAVTVLPSRVCT